VQFSGIGLHEVYANRAVYVEVNEAGVDRQPFEVKLTRPARVVRPAVFAQTRDAPALYEEGRPFRDRVRKYEARVSQ
jgi:hypothetical protein